MIFATILEFHTPSRSLALPFRLLLYDFRFFVSIANHRNDAQCICFYVFIENCENERISIHLSRSDQTNYEKYHFCRVENCLRYRKLVYILRSSMNKHINLDTFLNGCCGVFFPTLFAFTRGLLMPHAIPYFPMRLQSTPSNELL